MRKRLYIVFLFCAAWIFEGCNDGLDLNVTPPAELIVIDGWIEQGDQAKVFLTKNEAYFSTIDSASIRELVLSRAKVTISDGIEDEVLILRKDSRYFPPYYFAGNSLFGDTGRVYTITASYGGKSAFAETTIPAKVPIDTTWFQLLEESDTSGQIVLTFTDPGAERNYYRIFTKVKGKDLKFIPSFIIAINDQYFTGEQISFTLSRSPESFLVSFGNQYFHIDDTVIVKLVTMDEPSFQFWSSYQEEVINAVNPFASSMLNLQSNVEGEGLGIFSGYGVSIDTLINRESYNIKERLPQ